MPPVQTSYSIYHNSFVEGQLYDTTSAVIVSRNVEGQAPIGFARPLFQGTGDRGVVTGGTHTEKDFIGISVQDIMGDPGLFLMQNGTPDGYRVGGSIKTLTIGTIVVRTTTDVTANATLAVMSDGTSFGATGQSVYTASGLTVGTAGTGYVVGDVLTVQGAMGTVSEVAADGGLSAVILTAAPASATNYAGTYPVTGGSGTGGAVTIATKQVSGMLTLSRARFLATAPAGSLVPVEIR